MNRQLVHGTRALSITQQAAVPPRLSRSLSSRTDPANRDGSGKVSSIREWLESSNNIAEVIPVSVVKTEHKRFTRKSSRSARSNLL